MKVQRQFPYAIFVVGPTASGKTALAHRLAEQIKVHMNLQCALVNLDAFQFYRNVSLGTAKPSKDEIQLYKYTGIDILEPLESMDAVRYAEFVWQSCRDIAALGHMPICVGGSGLYLRSVLHGLDKLPPRHDSLRDMFRSAAGVWGWPLLHGWLQALAPVRAAQLHPNDKTRIERALEIVFQLPDGIEPDSVFRVPEPLSQQEMLGDCYVIQVDCRDEILKERIRIRLDDMFERGWVGEVAQLIARYGKDFLESQAGQAIGYRDIVSVLEDVGGDELVVTELQRQQLKQRIATLTWQYVRRQRTWNAKEKCDWSLDSSQSIVEIQFTASFLSFLKRYCF